MKRRGTRERGVLTAAVLALCLGAAPLLGGGLCLAGTPVDTTPADSIQSPAAPPAAAPPGTQPRQAASAAAAAAEDIRDIRGPRTQLPVWLIAAIVAAVLVLGAAGYALWRWRRRPKPIRLLSPAEIALKRLEEIRALMRPDGVREFSVAVSDVVRRYIEARFHVTAARRTTEEFLHDLLTALDAVLVQHRGLLEEFLRQCDLAKFADMSLSTQNMESLHHSARLFVLETAASAAPVPGAAAPAPGPGPVVAAS